MIFRSLVASNNHSAGIKFDPAHQYQEVFPLRKIEVSVDHKLEDSAFLPLLIVRVPTKLKANKQGI